MKIALGAAGRKAADRATLTAPAPLRAVNSGKPAPDKSPRLPFKVVSAVFATSAVKQFGSLRDSPADSPYADQP